MIELSTGQGIAVLGIWIAWAYSCKYLGFFGIFTAFMALGATAVICGGG